MRIAVSSLARNEMVRFGVAVEKQSPRYRKPRLKIFSITLDTNRAESTLWGIGNNGTRIEHATRTETLQGHTAHEQRSGGTHAEESSPTVGPGTHLPGIQVVRRLRRHKNDIKIRWVPTSKIINSWAWRKSRPDPRRKGMLHLKHRSSEQSQLP